MAFPFLWAYYGAGVLLIRDLWVRRSRSAMELMLLGFAYGVIEEGIFVKSWFDPSWPDLGILGTYGRMFGTNMVWATWLTIFHGYMSIWVPVTAFTLIFPDLGEAKLLGKRSAALLLASFLGVGILMAVVLNPYRPPVVQYTITVLFALVLITLSHRPRFPELRDLRLLRRHPVITGLIYSVLLFLIFVIIPYSAVPFLVPIILGVPVAVLFFWIQRDAEPPFSHALLIGSISFWLLFMDFALATMGYPLEFPLGLVSFGALLWLYLRERSKIAAER